MGLDELLATPRHFEDVGWPAVAKSLVFVAGIVLVSHLCLLARQDPSLAAQWLGQLVGAFVLAPARAAWRRLRRRARWGHDPPMSVTPGHDDDEVLDDLIPARVEAARDAAPPARLAELEAKIARAVQRSRAEATLRAYRADWADFAAWCEQVGFAPLPATPAAVAAYVAELADPPDDRPPRAVATIERRLAAIGEGHKVAGHPNPAADGLVRETMKGIRRMLGVAHRQKKGLSTEDLRAVVTSLGDRPIDLRDRAILLVGFAGGFRRNELASLDVADLEAHPAGLLVRLRISKTDQERAGRKVEIVYGTDEATCPVRSARRWVDAIGGSGPWLRRVGRHGNVSAERLSAQAIGMVVKRHMARLGYDTRDFAGHSLRRGMATTAARNGAAERTIMRTTGHTATDTLRGYITEAEEFTDPASGYLGL